MPIEITFVMELRTGQNPNPGMRKQYGEDLGTEMFQKLKFIGSL
jgi:hypothetical protein